MWLLSLCTVKHCSFIVQKHNYSRLMLIETPQKHVYVPELFKSVMCNSRKNYDLIHKEESKWSMFFFPQPASKSLLMSIKLVRYPALVTCATTVVSVRLYCQLIRFQYEVFRAINVCKFLFSTPELSSISCFQPQGLDYFVTCLPGKTNRNILMNGKPYLIFNQCQSILKPQLATNKFETSLN